MRVFFRSLRCFFFAIRLRRFLTTEPTNAPSGRETTLVRKRQPNRRDAGAENWSTPAHSSQESPRPRLPPCGSDLEISAREALGGALGHEHDESPASCAEDPGRDRRHGG